jgi:fumarate reductase subunit D
MSTPPPKNALHDKPIYLRDYSKAIFFYPLFLYSAFAWIIQGWQEWSGNDNGAPISWVSLIWMIIFFGNLFVTAFDFPSAKALLLFAIIMIIVLVVGLLYATGTIQVSDLNTDSLYSFNLDIKAKFYGFVTVILGIVLGFVLLESLFKYVKIETNEVYLKGITGKAERLPTGGLRIKKEISDVFEFIALRSGSITLLVPNHEPIILNTVPFVNKAEKHIDELLSVVKVSTRP